MKITLTQTGGLLGRTKTASADWPFSSQQFKELVKNIKAKKDSSVRDGYGYFLRTDASIKEIPVTIENIDTPYSEVFDELVEKLKFVS